MIAFTKASGGCVGGVYSVLHDKSLGYGGGKNIICEAPRRGTEAPWMGCGVV